MSRLENVSRNIFFLTEEDVSREAYVPLHAFTSDIIDVASGARCVVDGTEHLMFYIWIYNPES